ncbi:MAG: Gfo/Idh/MocA family oxidoreductase, partial [Bacteroidales bacterium]|nr:Gfo/Idh/MocA family oxidoreductase [Bacteroidales bacterium]
MIYPIKTGLLSFGMSGKIFHSPFLTVHDGFQLTAVVERSMKKAQAEYPNIKSYDSVNELLADPEIELVVVNTPNPTHYEYALNALQAGKHVLLEKPFTVNSAEAKQLFEEARKFNRHILPYQNRRFDSDYLSVREVLASGKLGRLVEMHIRFDRYRQTIGPKAAQETQVPGSGLMYNLGPHLLDAVIAIFGKPLHWRKTLGYFRKNTLVDDY